MAGHGLVKGALFMVAGGNRHAAGGLLPAGLIDGGFGRIADAAVAEGQGWLCLPLVACAAGTGAAVLRTTGRIFLGWGPVPSEEDRSPTDEEREKDDRPLWLMLLPALALLAGSCVDAAGAGRIASSATLALMPPGAADGPACQLSWRHLPGWLAGSAQRVLDPLSAGLRFLHDGAVGDYIAWAVVGLALLTAAFGLS